MRSAPEAHSPAVLTAVRAEPVDDAEQVTQALPGEPLFVLERAGGWARIVTSYDYAGWVRESALKTPPRSDWLGPERDGEPVEEARAYLGSPYEWGGMTERGIDCSGLVHMAYRRLGRLVPRDAHQQEAAAKTVRADALRLGDLVVYGAGTQADHIAFWLGVGRILHATRRDGVGGVIEEEQPAELRERLRGYVRL